MDSLRIRLLGPIEVWRGAGRIAVPGRKTQALLVYLAAQERAHTRRELFDLFCAEADDPPAALRWHLSRLRRALGASAILAQEESIQFNSEIGPVDCIEFGRALSANLVGQELETLTAVVDLYRGELATGLTLPDSSEFELWLLGERTRLRELYERGLSELIARLVVLQEYDSAIRRARQLLQSNSLLEQAHAYLIWLYASTGQIHAALEQYENCREILRRELAVEPTPALQELYQQVRSSQLGPAITVSTPHALSMPDLRQSIQLVGREAELAELGRAWQEACAQRGSMVLVQAEAGGGKTRLIHEFARRTADADFLYGQCYESTRPLPYHPWIELLEKRLAELDEASWRSWSPFWLDQLRRLLPSLAGKLGLEPVNLPPLQGDESERLFTAVYEFLFEMEDSPRQLICVDDLQWADEASLRLYHFLARRIPQTSALLIGLYRSEEVDAAPALQTLLRDLARAPRHELRLPPLTPAAIANLVERLWSLLPTEDIPTVSRMLDRATGGNPLFVTEVLRELTQTMTVPPVLPVPDTVRDLIHRRLSQLPESARQVIEAIAVLDTPASLSQAQHMSARTEEETTEAVDLGLRTRLLLAMPGPPPARYDFSHDLVREATLNQVGEVRKRLLHRRAAAMLARTAGGLKPAERGELAGRITRHAMQGEAYDLVLAWAPWAAALAQQLCAYGDALQAYEAASFALGQLRAEGNLDATAATSRELELLLRRIRMLYRLGRRSDQARLLEQASKLLASNPDARLEATFHLRQAALLTSTSQYARGYEAAQRAYERYERLGDLRNAAQALQTASDAKQSLGEISTARQLLEQAIDLYRAAGDVRSENRSQVDLAWCLIELSQLEAALKHLARSLEIAKQQGDKLGMAYSYFVMTVAWNLYCYAPRINFYAQKALELYEELGNEAFQARAEMYVAVTFWYENDRTTARERFARTLIKARAAGDSFPEGWIAHMLGRIALMDQDLASAEHWLQYASELRHTSGMVHAETSDLAWHGRLCLLQGQTEQALALTAEATQRLNAVQSEAQIWEAWDVWMCRAEALAAAGDNTAAAQFLQRAVMSLVQFAAWISDPQIKQSFLKFHLNARILKAGTSGHIKTFPE